MAARMGRRHLESPPTAVTNHLLTGLWVVKALSPTSTCLQCVCAHVRRVSVRPEGCRVERRYAVTQVPLQISRTVKCVLGNSVMKFREFPLLPNVPSFHPKAGWHPGIREGGVSQWPYSHHQATDHPGHHPDSLGDDPKRQPEGRSLRSWGKGPSGAAVHLSLGVGGDHHP